MVDSRINEKHDSPSAPPLPALEKYQRDGEAGKRGPGEMQVAVCSGFSKQIIYRNSGQPRLQRYKGGRNDHSGEARWYYPAAVDRERSAYRAGVAEKILSQAKARTDARTYENAVSMGP